LQPEKGSILDIGAGTGDFLSVAKEWLAHNRVKPSEKAKAIAKKKVFHLLKKQRIRESFFDVISMWHVWNVPNLENKSKN
jgi:precorrin-6B methylase 2